MSVFRKTGVRCDTCGKFSMGKPTGEYTRKDGTVGYIWPVEDEAGNVTCTDMCEECSEQENQKSAEAAFKQQEGTT